MEDWVLILAAFLFSVVSTWSIIILYRLWEIKAMLEAEGY